MGTLNLNELSILLAGGDDPRTARTYIWFKMYHLKTNHANQIDKFLQFSTMN